MLGRPGPRRLLVSVAVAVALVSGLAACSAQASKPEATLAPVAVLACPVTPSVPQSTSVAGASQTPVPFTPTTAILCKYNSQAGHASLAGVSRLPSRDQAAKTATEINSSTSRMPSGAISCPNDTGGSYVGIFQNRSDRIMVVIRRTGCTVVSNGALEPSWVLNSRLIQTLNELTWTRGS